jgi:hypothetical protein
VAARVWVLLHHRKHLTALQKAFVGARIANLGRGGDRGNQYTGGKPPDGGLAISAERAAEITGASQRQIANLSAGSNQNQEVSEVPPSGGTISQARISEKEPERSARVSRPPMIPRSETPGQGRRTDQTQHPRVPSSQKEAAEEAGIGAKRRKTCGTLLVGPCARVLQK